MFSRTDYQQLQHRLGYFFVQELAQIKQAYNLGGNSMTDALNQFEQEWDQLQQLWEHLIARGTPDDVALCAALVQGFQPYLLARVSVQHMIKILEQTLALLPADSFPQARLSACFLLGSAHQLMTNYAPMLQQYEQAMALALAQDAHWYRNEINNKLSHYHYEHARYDEALHHAQQIIHPDSGSADNQRASAALNIGNVHTNQHNFAQAEHYLRQGLSYFEKTDDQNSAMHAHVNLGHLFSSAARHEQAAHHYHLSLDINNKVSKNKRISATVFFNLAVNANRRGDYVETLFYARLSMREYKALDNQWGISRALNTIGIAHLRQGRHSEADAIFRDVTTMRYEIGFTSGVIFVVANRIQNWNLAGEYGQALSVLQEYLPDMIQIQTSIRPRFRLIALAVWTLTGLNLATQEIFNLVDFVRATQDLDWETGTFLEKIDAYLADKPTLPASTHDLTVDTALDLLAQSIAPLDCKE